jgi:CBS domain-containing protein
MVVVPSGQDGAARAITHLDLIRAGLRRTPRETAGDIARDPISTVAKSATLEQAASTMATLDVAHLMVGDADSQSPQGVLSSFDIVSAFSGRDPRLTPAIRPGAARPSVSPTRLADISVGQVMRRGLISCQPDTPIHELAGRMADLRVHCVAVSGVVTRHDGDEHLMWGLVSDMDVVHAAHRGREATAGEVAATAPIALPEDAALERAANLMASHDLTHVVVVGRTGLPSGVVSSLDVIRILGAG